jgi:hypothetical protein
MLCLTNLRSSIMSRKRGPKLTRIIHKSISVYRYLFIRRSEWATVYGQQAGSHAGKNEPISVLNQCCILMKSTKKETGSIWPL